MSNGRPPSPLSIAVCAFNGLEYTRLLVDSIRRHSAFSHEILIYSDGSTDGTAPWLRAERDLVWQHDRKNRGICTAMNRVARMATREYLFFPNTDHVLGPGWDTALLARLAARTVVSCQCIEPGIVPVAPIFHARNCGTRSDEFDEARFHLAVREVSKNQETPGVNYPFALPKALWEDVGGLDERFDPGPANDPDLFYRLSFLGARMVRAEDVIVYHFSGKSSRMADEAKAERREWHEITDRNERRFVEKWGEAYRYANGGLPDPGPEARRRWTGMTRPAAKVEVDTPLRVTLDARSVTPKEEGIGVYTLNLIQALLRLKKGPLLRCLSGTPVYLKAALGNHDRLQVEKCDVPQGSRDAERELGQRFGGKETDLFHGPSFWIPGSSSVPSVVTVHDLAFLLHPEWYPAPFVEHLKGTLSESLESARQVIAVSDRTKDDLERHYPSVKGRVTRIYEALPRGREPVRDSNLQEAVLDRFGGGRSFILAVGMKQRRKNALGLVRAFAKLAGREGSRPSLVLVGGAESEEPALLIEIEKLGVKDEVVLTGHLSAAELSRLYSTCALMVYPSFHEGFGLPLLEAMAAGIPIACSNAASLPEVAGDAVLYFDPADPDSIAESMRKVLEDPSLRKGLIDRGHARLGQFSWEKAAAETLAVYRAAIEPRSQVVSSPRVERPRTAGTNGRSRKRIAVDARLLGQDRIGTGRYTGEILRALLAQPVPAEFVLIGPRELHERFLPDTSRILEHVEVGPETLFDPAWEQFSLPSHLLGCDLYFAPTSLTPVTKPCKMIPVIHDLGFLDHPEHYEPGMRSHFARWIRNSCLASDAVVAVSEFTKRRTVKAFNLPEDRVRVVHHGCPSVQSPRAEPTSSVLGNLMETSYVLSVSSFEPNKNLDVLLLAFARIAPEWPGQLVLAGRSGRELARLISRVQELGVAARVRFMPDLSDEDLSLLYRRASAFAFPSLYEGFGLPLLEAMAEGIPVVANRIASCPEVVGDAGILLEEATPEAWSQALIGLLKDPEFGRKLSSAARERARHFTWKRAARETWSLIEQCLETP